MSPIFWTLGDKYKILAVHKFEISDGVSGYRRLSQNASPDQWQKLIGVKKQYFELGIKLFQKKIRMF